MNTTKNEMNHHIKNLHFYRKTFKQNDSKAISFSNTKRSFSTNHTTVTRILAFLFFFQLIPFKKQTFHI